MQWEIWLPWAWRPASQAATTPGSEKDKGVLSCQVPPFPRGTERPAVRGLAESCKLPGVKLSLLTRLAQRGSRAGASRCWLPGPSLSVPAPMTVLLDQAADASLHYPPPATRPLSHAHSCLFSRKLSLPAYPAGPPSSGLRGREQSPFPEVV